MDRGIFPAGHYGRSELVVWIWCKMEEFPIFIDDLSLESICAHSTAFPNFTRDVMYQ